MRLIKLTIIFQLLLLSVAIFCAEIDQLTDREKYQENAVDFTFVLNLYTNKLIAEAIDNYNFDFKNNSDIELLEIQKLVAFEIYKVTAANSNAHYGSYIPNRVGLLYALGKSGRGPIQEWIESDENKPYWIKLNENIYFQGKTLT